jgi:hypothetical protein
MTSTSVSFLGRFLADKGEASSLRFFIKVDKDVKVEEDGVTKEEFKDAKAAVRKALPGLLQSWH